MSVTGPANILDRKQAHLRQVLVEALTDDDVRAVAKKLVELAKDGDLRATRLLLHYGLGKPGAGACFSDPPTSRANGQPNLSPMTLAPLPAELNRDQIRKEAGADTKRKETAAPKPVSVPPGQAVSLTESMRLVKRPER
ncbi:MAG: hypothetical protein U0797_20675 [Gemmataceae bacterium]